MSDLMTEFFFEPAQKKNGRKKLTELDFKIPASAGGEKCYFFLGVGMRFETPHPLGFDV